eukprot:Hpha_TRINITY_DN25245_c0_g1::TRINITY_DN25245_c0_g1_i1::g.110790::m.110790
MEGKKRDHIEGAKRGLTVMRRKKKAPAAAESVPADLSSPPPAPTSSVSETAPEVGGQLVPVPTGPPPPGLPLSADSIAHEALFELRRLKISHDQLRHQYEKRCEEVIVLRNVMTSPAMLADPDTKLRDRLEHTHKQLTNLKELRNSIMSAVGAVSEACQAVRASRTDLMQTVHRLTEYLSQLVSQSFPKLKWQLEAYVRTSENRCSQVDELESELYRAREELRDVVELRAECDNYRTKWTEAAEQAASAEGEIQSLSVRLSQADRQRR